jgi:hypothetical protein
VTSAFAREGVTDQGKGGCDEDAEIEADADRQGTMEYAEQLILPSRSFVLFASLEDPATSLDQVNVDFDDEDAERSTDAAEHLFVRSLRSCLMPILLFLFSPSAEPKCSPELRRRRRALDGSSRFTPGVDIAVAPMFLLSVHTRLTPGFCCSGSSLRRNRSARPSPS